MWPNGGPLFHQPEEGMWWAKRLLNNQTSFQLFSSRSHSGKLFKHIKQSQSFPRLGKPSGTKRTPYCHPRSPHLWESTDSSKNLSGGPPICGLHHLTVTGNSLSVNPSKRMPSKCCVKSSSSCIWIWRVQVCLRNGGTSFFPVYLFTWRIRSFWESRDIWARAVNHIKRGAPLLRWMTEPQYFIATLSYMGFYFCSSMN